MKSIIRSDIPIELTVLLVILTIVLAFIIVPFLLVVGFCRLVRFFIPDSSDGLRPSGKGRTAPHAGDGETAASSDDTIDCEVISSRTLDENGQEIR